MKKNNNRLVSFPQNIKDLILHDTCNLTKQPLDGDKDTFVPEHLAWIFNL